MKISTGLLLATTLFRTNTNINVQPKQPLNANQTNNETIQLEKTDTYQWDSNYNAELYQLNGEVTNNLFTLQINQMTLKSQRTNYQYTIYNYLNIVLIGTMPNYKIEIASTNTLTGETAETIQVEEYTYLNIDKYENWLNPTYIKNNQMFRFDPVEDPTEGRNYEITNTNYSYYNEQDTTTVQIELNTTGTKETNILIEKWYTKQQTNGQITPTEITFVFDTVAPTQELIDLAGLLFYILTMPFSFISQAFNLTLFPNTPYQINIANMLFAILGSAIVILIIRKVLH